VKNKLLVEWSETNWILSPASAPKSAVSCKTASLPVYPRASIVVSSSLEANLSWSSTTTSRVSSPTI